MKQFYDFILKHFTLRGKMMKIGNISMMFLLMFFICSLQTVFSQEPYADFRIVNLRYEPTYVSWNNSYLGKAVVFDLQVKPGANYGVANLTGGQILIEFLQQGNHNNFYLQFESNLPSPNPYAFGKASWIPDNPFLTPRDIIYVTFERALNPPLLPLNEFVTVTTIFVPVFNEPAQGDFAKILPRTMLPPHLGGGVNQNSSFWTGGNYLPEEQSPIAFCPDKFYYGIDPYAKADFTAIPNLFCVGDPYYVLPTSVLDTNGTDPVNQNPLYYYNWYIPGKWQVNGVDSAKVNTDATGTVKYTFVPLPTDGYCNFSNADLTITIINANNIQIGNLTPVCEGVPIDLREAIMLLDPLNDNIDNYAFYEKISSTYVPISPIVSPPAGKYTDVYYVKNILYNCPGASYIPIEVTVKPIPEAPFVVWECKDPENNWVTAIEILPYDGATPPFTGYSVSIGGGYTNQWNYSKADLWNPDGSAGYSITVMLNGCVSEPTNITCITCPAEPEIESFYVAQHPSACGEDDGEIQFYVSGGSGDFTYSVFNGEGNLFETGTYTTGFVAGLGAGTYYIEVTDNQYNCSTIRSQYVTLREENSDLKISVTAKDASDCIEEDGALYISVSGGTGNYDFTVIGTNKPILNGKIEGLPAGEYEVIVNSNLCTTSSGKVRINSIVDLDVFDMNIVKQTDAVCNMNDASATVAIFGHMEYWYQLDYRPVKSATRDEDTLYLKHLGAGEHILRLFNDCAEKSFKFTIHNSNSNDLAFKAEAENVIYYCNDIVKGKISIKILTGVAPYYYSIDNTDWELFTKDTTLTNMLEGTYKIRVKDAAGCYYEVNDITIGTENAQPVTIGSIYVMSHPAACGATNGSITFDVSGGSGSFSYRVYKSGVPIGPPADYPAGVPVTGLGAGTYYVVVTDKLHNCDFATSASVTLVEENSNLFINVTTKDASDCMEEDGALYINVTGGTGNYNYTVIGTTKQVEDGKIEGLKAGEYEVVVTSGPCTASSGKVRINSKDDWDAFTMTTLYVVPTPCGEKQGVAVLEISGKVPYGYQLNYEGSPIPAVATEVITFTNLEAGEHTLLLISDCAERAFTFTVPNKNNDALVFTIEKKNAVEHCDGAVDPGYIKLIIGTGVPPYQYSLNGSQWKIFTKDTTLLIKEGIYKIRVIDNNNCLYVINDVTIDMEQALPVNIGSIFATANPVCKDVTGGAIQFYVSGGSGSYNYELYYNGVLLKGDVYNNTPITGLATGNYYIVVWDNLHSCNKATSHNFVLSNSGTVLDIVVSPTNATGCNEPDGKLIVNVYGGIPELYTLFDATGNVLSTNPPPYIMLPAGIYVVQVTDTAGCVAISGEVRIASEPDASGLSLTILDKVAPTTCGINNGVVIFEIEGNTPYYYQLNSGDIVMASNPETVIITGLAAGEHKLRVFNNCGEITETFIIESSNGLFVTATPGNSKVDCSGVVSDGYIALAVTGTSSKYWYTYDGGFTWKEFTTSKDTIWDLKQGIYLIEVRDEDNCTYHVGHVEILREVDCDLELKLIVFLQGVTHEGPSMTTYLQGPSRFPGLVDDKLLPVHNPYTYKPEYYHQINDPSGPAGEVVDWILIEVISNFETFEWDDIEYTYYDLVESQALLLKPDGTVVDTNGNFPKFRSYFGDDVRIAVKHRNHLSVLSSALFTFTSDIPYNFSESPARSYKMSWTKTEPTVLRNDVWCLYAGDIWNGNPVDATRNVINASDIERFNSKIRMPVSWISGTLMVEDVNMDAQLDGSDDTFINTNARQVIQSPLLYFIKRP